MFIGNYSQYSGSDRLEEDLAIRTRAEEELPNNLEGDFKEKMDENQYQNYKNSGCPN